MRFIAEVDVLVDLVAQHQEIRVVEHHPGQGLQLGPRIDRPGRVARTGEDEEARPLGQRGAEGIGRDLEIMVDRGGDAHHIGIGHVRDARITHPVWCRQDDVLAGIDRAEHDVRDGLLGPGADHHLVGRVGQAVLALELAADGLAQGEQAGHGRVACVARVDGVLAGLADMVRGVEVGLPERETDDIGSRSGQVTRLLGHLDGGRGGDALDETCEVHGRDFGRR